MADPAAASARADAERSGTVMGGDVDRIEAAIHADLRAEANWRCPHDRSGTDRDTATYCPAAKLVTPAEADELWGAWLTGEGRPA